MFQPFTGGGCCGGGLGAIGAASNPVGIGGKIRPGGGPAGSTGPTMAGGNLNEKKGQL